MSCPTTEPRSYDDLWQRVYGEMQDHGPAHRHMRRLLAGLLADLDYATAIEVGCGAGHNFGLISRPDLERLAGVDISTEALRRAARAWPAAELSKLDIQSRALAGSWDLIFCSLVLEHLADDERALTNMRAMTDRYLVVSTIAGDYDRYLAWERQVGHVRNYRRGELEAKLERAGFVVERSIYWGFPFYTPLARRLQNRVPAEAEHGSWAALAARVLYGLYWLNSSRRGDILLVVARADGRSPAQ